MVVDASAVDDMVRTVFEGQDVDEETKARTGLVRREIRRVKARVVGDTFMVAALNNNEFIIISSLPTQCQSMSQPMQQLREKIRN